MQEAQHPTTPDAIADGTARTIVDVALEQSEALPMMPHKKRKLAAISHPLNVSSPPNNSSSVKLKESIINCMCIPKVENEDDFYISCDYCSEWFHGICHSIDEDTAKGIHIWACATCMTFGKSCIMLAKCAGCNNYSRNITLPNHTKLSSDASKYCSDECGQKLNKPNVQYILKSITKSKSIIKYFQTHSNSKFDSLPDLYTYDELTEEMDALFSKKEYLKIEIQKYEEKLLLLDQIVDNVRNINVNKANNEMVCGFDYSIIKGDMTIHERLIEIPKFTQEVIIEPQVSTIPETTDSKMEEEKVKEDYTSVCEKIGKCMKHTGWQKLKTLETEIHLDELKKKYLQLCGLGGEV